MALQQYVDEDLSDSLPGFLGGLGHDAVHTRAIGNSGFIDPEQLAYAARHGRVLLTSNFDDFRMLHEAWLVWTPEWAGAGASPHPGILVVPNPNEMNADAMARLVDAFVRRADMADLRNRLFRWRASTGWLDYSAVRRPAARS